MKKLSVLVPALALAVMMSASALAENGAVSEATLNAMGLGGMQVMSDQDAMAVRGKGFVGHGFASSYGNSSSSISIGANLGPFAGFSFDTSSEDGFRARGRYLSGGTQISESIFETTISNSTEVSGVGTVTRTLGLSIRIGSGGSASSYSL